MKAENIVQFPRWRIDPGNGFYYVGIIHIFFGILYSYKTSNPSFVLHIRKLCEFLFSFYYQEYFLNLMDLF